MALEIGPVTKQQKIAIAVIAVIGLVFFYSKVYAPLGEKITKSKNKLEKKQKELRQMRLKAEQLDKLEKELELLEEQIKKAEEKLPKKQEVDKFIRTITRTANKYGMEVRTLRVSSEQSSDYYMIHPYGMQLQSDYHTLGNFFAEIGQMDRVFNIKNLSMNLSGEESEKKLSSGFSILTYTFKQ